MASVSASDVSDTNDNQNYLSMNENSLSGDISIQHANLVSVSSDSIDGDSDLIGASDSVSEDSKSQSSDSKSDASSSSIPDSSKSNSSDSKSKAASNSSDDKGELKGTTKNSTNISSSSSKIVRGNSYSVTLKDKNGKVLSGKQIVFTFNGKEYTKTTNANGMASLTISSANAGNYIITVFFAGDNDYESSTLTEQLTVSKTPTTIAKYSSSALNGKSYSVVLKDEKGNALSGKTVSITFNGKTYKCTTNANGLASITLSGTIGNTYKLSYSFAGDTNYLACSGSTDLKLKMYTYIDGSDARVVKGGTYTVVLKDGNGNVLANKAVTVVFNGKTYTKTSDAKGIIYLYPSPAPAKTYTVVYTYNGTSYYGDCTKTINLYIKTPTSITNSGTSIIGGKNYYLYLKNADGKALDGRTITIVYRGTTYKKTTDANGRAAITLSSGMGNSYTMTYSYAGTDYYGASSGSVNIMIKVPTHIEGSDARVVKGGTYTVVLKDGNGNVLANKAVTVVFNGKTYTKTSDAKGIIYLYPSPAPAKTYTVVYTYNGTSYYGDCTKTINLYIKTPTSITNSGTSIIGGKNYYLYLKNADGKALDGRTITIVYRGTTYKKTTDANGRAAITLSSGVGGTYKMEYSYAGTDYYGASSGSVNIKIKMGTTITGPSSTTFIKGNSYQVTLKDANGKGVSGKTVTFIFNGKTYTKTTNSNGVASLSITSPPAGSTRVISYSFAGDSNYGPSSSGNITLKIKASTSIKNSGTSMKNGTLYNVTLKDSDGNPLANKVITFTLDGKTYTNTTDSNGVAHIFISESSPKSTKLTYKFAGDDNYTSSSGSVTINVISEKIFTFAQIMAAAKNVKTYVLNNGKLPTIVTVNTIKLNIGNFTYLLAKAISNINGGKKIDVSLLNISSNYTNNGSASINGDLTKAQYISLVNTLISKLESNHQIPSYIDTNLGKVSPNLYIFGLSKVLAFYDTNARLPSTLTLNAKDVDGNASHKGNASQYKKGLNEIESLSAAELAKYLESSGNDALNADIIALAKSLTQGKSTIWAKAQAIFNYVRDNIEYEYYANTKYKATGTLSKKRGNCCDQANLVVALCRAVGIPARLCHAKNCKFNSGLVTGHVWAQIYVDGVWYSADATSKSNELGNIKNWNTNSFSNLNQYIHLPF